MTILSKVFHPARGAAVVLTIIGASTPAAVAEVITKCIGEAGQTVYFPTDQPTSAQWTDDRVTGGSILLLSDEGKIQLVTEDATGSVRSAASRGRLVTVRVDPAAGTYVLSLVIPNDTVETYLFRLDSLGRGTVATTVTRGGRGTKKASLMTASCAR